MKLTQKTPPRRRLVDFATGATVKFEGDEWTRAQTSTGAPCLVRRSDCVVRFFAHNDYEDSRPPRVPTPTNYPDGLYEVQNGLIYEMEIVND